MYPGYRYMHTLEPGTTISSLYKYLCRAWIEPRHVMQKADQRATALFLCDKKNIYYKTLSICLLYLL